MQSAGVLDLERQADRTVGQLLDPEHLGLEVRDLGLAHL